MARDYRHLHRRQRGRARDVERDQQPAARGEWTGAQSLDFSFFLRVMRSILDRMVADCKHVAALLRRFISNTTHSLTLQGTVCSEAVRSDSRTALLVTAAADEHEPSPAAAKADGMATTGAGREAINTLVAFLLSFTMIPREYNLLLNEFDSLSAVAERRGFAVPPHEAASRCWPPTRERHSPATQALIAAGHAPPRFWAVGLRPFMILSPLTMLCPAVYLLSLLPPAHLAVAVAVALSLSVSGWRMCREDWRLAAGRPATPFSQGPNFAQLAMVTVLLPLQVASLTGIGSAAVVPHSVDAHRTQEVIIGALERTRVQLHSVALAVCSQSHTLDSRRRYPTLSSHCSRCPPSSSSRTASACPSYSTDGPPTPPSTSRPAAGLLLLLCRGSRPSVSR